MIANTPKPPYYAVIFSTLQTDIDEGYIETADRVEALAQKQKGYLGIESVRTELGITVLYWKSLEAIKQWENNIAYTVARQSAKERWYKNYQLRICKVEYDYGFEK